MQHSRTREHSKTLYINGTALPGGEVDQVVPDRTTGRFPVNIPNALYTQKITKTIPVRVLVPNVFPNIPADAHIFTIFDGITTTTITIPVGYWTLAELATYLDGATPVGIAVAEVKQNGREGLVLTNSIGAPIIVTEVQPDTFFRLGFIEENKWEVVDVLRYFEVLNGNTYPISGDPDYPNLAGEPLVHVCIRDMAAGNLVWAKDGSPYDVAITIPLVDVPFGGIAAEYAQDLYVEDIDYQTELSLTNFEVILCNSRLEVMTLPPNYNVYLTFKLFHNESLRP